MRFEIMPVIVFIIGNRWSKTDLPTTAAENPPGRRAVFTLSLFGRYIWCQACSATLYCSYLAFQNVSLQTSVPAFPFGAKGSRGIPVIERMLA